ncbi:hypothetical protein D9619_001196 [Psilocybe cf. subviscida]|uniref:CP-type G domain-containing protein n=1 Tax=Psilocybe cf. subviscida TaxID=2480587 RepID=A0A8H5F211_9AGAR|nr:hypothetical protein D9619_001196 [Psilocybe cf. subviscida]
MPRIRKETSNRKSTNDRAKRRKQVKESKRKTAKAAKKNPQWKSKTPKDPGIPSEFPYKDQILAEVAEQRRLAAEEKERKKEEKARNLARARAIARGEIVEGEEDENEEESVEEGSDAEEADEDESSKPKSKKDLNVGAESIASLSAKLVGTKIKARPKPAPAAVEEDEAEEEVPVLLNRDLPNLKAVLEKADVVIEVLDGRDPAAFRSKQLEQLVQEMGKKTLIVVNKIDTCPREAVVSWSSELRSEQPTLLFRAASAFLPEQPTLLDPLLKKGKGKAPKPKTDDAVGAEAVRACLARWAKEKKGDEPLAVAIVGVTNVGKSAFVNSLLKRTALPIYSLASSSRGPTTTELPQEVTLNIEDQNILLIDTPGLSFVNNEDDEPSMIEQHRARDILLRSKGRIDRLKDPNPPVEHLVSRANSEDLMLLYSLPAFLKNDTTSFLSGVARANQLIKKKGEPDLTGAARIVLRDWSVGKLAHYTTPPTTSANTTGEPKQDAFLTELYAKDAALLEAIPTRKERRKQGGLVKLTALSADERKAAVEADWAGLQNAEDEESDSDDDDAEDANAEGMDVDSEGSAEEEESDEEEAEGDEEDEEEAVIAPPPRSNKQKRKAIESAPERPTKKVAFNAVVKAKASKPLKPVQASTKKQEKQPAVSALKTALKAKSAATKPSDNKVAKVANKPSTKKAASSEAKKDDNAPQAYDFGKFF